MPQPKTIAVPSALYICYTVSLSDLWGFVKIVKCDRKWTPLYENG